MAASVNGADSGDLLDVYAPHPAGCVAGRAAHRAAHRPVPGRVDPSGRTEAGRRAGAVFMYRLDFTTPVLDGKLGVPHALDLGFCFDNLDRTSLHGGRPEAPALAERMSEAWLAFARTGDPNHPGSRTGRPTTRPAGRRCCSTSTAAWPTIPTARNASPGRGDSAGSKDSAGSRGGAPPSAPGVPGAAGTGTSPKRPVSRRRWTERNRCRAPAEAARPGAGTVSSPDRRRCPRCGTRAGPGWAASAAVGRTSCSQKRPLTTTPRLSEISARVEHREREPAGLDEWLAGALAAPVGIEEPATGGRDVGEDAAPAVDLDDVERLGIVERGVDHHLPVLAHVGGRLPVTDATAVRVIHLPVRVCGTRPGTGGRVPRRRGGPAWPGASRSAARWSARRTGPSGGRRPGAPG